LASRKPALNTDLWGELLDLADYRDIRFVWVRGHNAHPENERCDVMAVEARQQEDLPPDEGYEEAAQSRAEQAKFDWL
jgi:ribonuclease HI